MDIPKEEQCGVVRVLTYEGVSQPAISCRMTAVHGVHCISLATVKCWSKRFIDGCECCKDNPSPGKSLLPITPNTIVQIVELIQQEWWISIDELTQSRIRKSFEAAFTHLIRNHNDGEDFLTAVEIEEESWCLRYETFFVWTS
ncbi:hypothetical protein TNIN_116621 [Trichonephila inaurata madagascariensis]|uniref:Transposase n=1 Tax=Trichonephila inaurata madagascariensis TaxID=2747483 RepID=A0A8X6YQC6_9ARAC|nr:hypothetical protein TNIN_116621 [Trichonephila inaurata madagascariensis]